MLLYIFAYLFPQRTFQMPQENLDTMKYTAKLKAEVLGWNENHLNKHRSYQATENK